MNKLLILITATLLLLTGCDHSNRELIQAKYDGHQEGLEEGEKAGFKTCEQSISRAAEALAAQIKMKNEVIDRQRESELEKALACSNSPINLCPDSWMVDIQSYQKLGYSGTAGEQTFWIGLANSGIPSLLMILFLVGPAMIYKTLKLETLAKESKKLGLMRQELKSENSKLDDRIANLTAEENQAMREANRGRLHEEKMCDQVRIQRKVGEAELEYFRSESAREIEETIKELAVLANEVAALKVQKKLFGG
ncbi:hypothetical protein ICN18_07330 [Polynucleobacter sp. Ross1-W9]|uniref:hypothetical protein n=1 Tax=Polynucleobacter parvulilacunae TaxID=1855631 RepID=UPI001C0D13A2|nr:hypothetical protein [Polynucleobacter parvulilacunae]MBU3557437.1 hypothetical protein [Polynucleobacter parvulilacunae]